MIHDGRNPTSETGLHIQIKGLLIPPPASTQTTNMTSQNSSGSNKQQPNVFVPQTHAALAARKLEGNSAPVYPAVHAAVNAPDFFRCVSAFRILDVTLTLIALAQNLQNKNSTHFTSNTQNQSSSNQSSSQTHQRNNQSLGTQILEILSLPALLIPDLLACVLSLISPYVPSNDINLQLNQGRESPSQQGQQSQLSYSSSQTQQHDHQQQQQLGSLIGAQPSPTVIFSQVPEIQIPNEITELAYKTRAISQRILPLPLRASALSLCLARLLPTHPQPEFLSRWLLPQSPQLLITSFCTLYERDPAWVPRVLDFCQEAKCIDIFLFGRFSERWIGAGKRMSAAEEYNQGNDQQSGSDYYDMGNERGRNSPQQQIQIQQQQGQMTEKEIILGKELNQLRFAIPPNLRLDIACLASRREYLNIEKWLEKMMDDNEQQSSTTTAPQPLQQDASSSSQISKVTPSKQKRNQQDDNNDTDLSNTASRGQVNTAITLDNFLYEGRTKRVRERFMKECAKYIHEHALDPSILENERRQQSSQQIDENSTSETNSSGSDDWSSSDEETQWHQQVVSGGSGIKKISFLSFKPVSNIRLSAIRNYQTTNRLWEGKINNIVAFVASTAMATVSVSNQYQQGQQQDRYQYSSNDEMNQQMRNNQRSSPSFGSGGQGSSTTNTNILTPDILKQMIILLRQHLFEMKPSLAQYVGSTIDKITQQSVRQVDRNRQGRISGLDSDAINQEQRFILPTSTQYSQQVQKSINDLMEAFSLEQLSMDDLIYILKYWQQQMQASLSGRFPDQPNLDNQKTLPFLSPVSDETQKQRLDLLSSQLIQELAFISKNQQPQRKKISSLLGRMINANIFDSKKTMTILGSVLEMLRRNPDKNDNAIRTGCEIIMTIGSEMKNHIDFFRAVAQIDTLKETKYCLSFLSSQIQESSKIYQYRAF
ncbi:MAG: hypothetical protein EZS28_031101 [Streblomastix strix]|uniref:CCR4-NOT transcription complex subunit 1 HEAT repeat domain-containing protein n=2 Tax=Streblomastix strix TaxID=222440 RepID=A0A5J4UTF4_9EUKA|nr:MAG: hypothetical protein EZS28_031101 [Streblomastix strix]